MKKEEIERAASLCLERQGGEFPSAYASFVDGAEWALGQTTWRSLKDGMPPLREQVLLLFNGTTPIIGIGVRVADKTLNITHWMPIPEIPKTGKGGKP